MADPFDDWLVETRGLLTEIRASVGEVRTGAATLLARATEGRDVAIQLHQESRTLGARGGPWWEVAVPLREAVLLGSKAAYAAGLIGGAAAEQTVTRAASHRSDVIRVAPAATLRYLSAGSAARVVATLVRDEDIGVLKQTLHCIRAHRLSQFKPWVQRISSDAADHPLAALAREIAAELPNP